MTSPTNIDPRALPDPIRNYLDAHAVRDTDSALQFFEPVGRAFGDAVEGAKRISALTSTRCSSSGPSPSMR